MNQMLNPKEYSNPQEHLLDILTLLSPVQCLPHLQRKYNKLKLLKHHQIEKMLLKGKLPLKKKGQVCLRELGRLEKGRMGKFIKRRIYLLVNLLH